MIPPITFLQLSQKCLTWHSSPQMKSWSRRRGLRYWQTV